mmetsp:Transcript_58762/g.161242  ORF Transcript_58762/g.161242 Transcript_58762/m.161242 type:complete len:231 (-) Transcript_58762:368-1060(-)
MGAPAAPSARGLLDGLSHTGGSRAGAGTARAHDALPVGRRVCRHDGFGDPVLSDCGPAFAQARLQSRGRDSTPVRAARRAAGRCLTCPLRRAGRRAVRVGHRAAAATWRVGRRAGGWAGRQRGSSGRRAADGAQVGGAARRCGLGGHARQRGGATWTRAALALRNRRPPTQAAGGGPQLHARRAPMGSSREAPLATIDESPPLTPAAAATPHRAQAKHETLAEARRRARR